ncbi:hypothetical protein J6590_073614 [Homalodisca vitripennis]|nr:hypothetical protein J6590_073614 [Homalodisca vitripennis]
MGVHLPLNWLETTTSNTEQIVGDDVIDGCARRNITRKMRYSPVGVFTDKVKRNVERILRSFWVRGLTPCSDMTSAATGTDRSMTSPEDSGEYSVGTYDGPATVFILIYISESFT